MRFALTAILIFLIAIMTATGPVSGEQQYEDQVIEPAIVSIEVTQQRPNWYSPWQRNRPIQSSGSGFLIGKRRVMTNAHVVSDAKQIIVRRNQDNRPYFAKIEFIGHDSDLATLVIADPGFAKGVKPLVFGGLPSLRSRVRAYGYPAGGEKISRTEGVVSRIQFITYLHSGADTHLGVQTDSAINPGNSGGPVIQEGKVVGVAFQTNSRLNDVGYFIPTTVIQRFLRDIEDARYDGFPDIGLTTSNLINPSYRKYLGLPGNTMAGVVVDRVYKKSSADGYIRKNDVIMAIDGIPVRFDGTINFKGFTPNFEQIVEEKLIGEKVELQVFRKGKTVQLEIPLKLFPEVERMRAQFDTNPRYFIYAGLVFMELNLEFLKTFGNYREKADKHLLYSHFYAFVESNEQSTERVVLSRVLPHKVNSVYRGMENFYLSTLNGVPIGSLKDIEKGLRAGKNGFHRFELNPGKILLVIGKKESDLAHPEILKKYGIRRDRRLE